MVVQPCGSRCYVPITGQLGSLVESYGRRHKDPYHLTLGKIMRAYGRYYCTQNENGQLCGDFLFSRIRTIIPPEYAPLGLGTGLAHCTCQQSFLQDGECDPACFTSSCSWDGEDCKVERMFPEIYLSLMTILDRSCLFYNSDFVCTPKCRAQYLTASGVGNQGCCLTAALEVMGEILSVDAEHPLVEAKWKPQRSIAFLEQTCGSTFDRTCSAGRPRVVEKIEIVIGNVNARALINDTHTLLQVKNILRATVAVHLNIANADVTRIVARPSGNGLALETDIDSGVLADTIKQSLQNPAFLENLASAYLTRLGALDLSHVMASSGARRLLGVSGQLCMRRLQQVPASSVGGATGGLTVSISPSSFRSEMVVDPQLSLSTSPGAAKEGTVGLEEGGIVTVRQSCNPDELYSLGPGYTLSTEASDAAGFEDGATRTITCASGYEATRGPVPDTLRCDNGKWVLAGYLQCSRRCEGNPAALYEMEPQRYEVAGSGNQHGAMRVVTCTQGYTASVASPTTSETGTRPGSGSEGGITIQCVDGSWTQVTLLCKAACANPETVLGPEYRVDAGGRRHGQTRKLSCAAGYYPKTSTELSCNDGSWDGLAQFTCSLAEAPGQDNSASGLAKILQTVFSGPGILGALIGCVILLVLAVGIFLAWRFYFRKKARKNIHEREKKVEDLKQQAVVGGPQGALTGDDGGGPYIGDEEPPEMPEEGSAWQMDARTGANVHKGGSSQASYVHGKPYDAATDAYDDQASGGYDPYDDYAHCDRPRATGWRYEHSDDGYDEKDGSRRSALDEGAHTKGSYARGQLPHRNPSGTDAHHPGLHLPGRRSAPAMGSPSVHAQSRGFLASGLADGAAVARRAPRRMGDGVEPDDRGEPVKYRSSQPGQGEAPRRQYGAGSVGVDSAQSAVMHDGSTRGLARPAGGAAGHRGIADGAENVPWDMRSSVTTSSMCSMGGRRDEEDGAGGRDGHPIVMRANDPQVTRHYSGEFGSLVGAPNGVSSPDSAAKSHVGTLRRSKALLAGGTEVGFAHSVRGEPRALAATAPHPRSRGADRGSFAMSMVSADRGRGLPHGGGVARARSASTSWRRADRPYRTTSPGQLLRDSGSRSSVSCIGPWGGSADPNTSSPSVSSAFHSPHSSIGEGPSPPGATKPGHAPFAPAVALDISAAHSARTPVRNDAGAHDRRPRSGDRRRLRRHSALDVGPDPSAVRPALQTMQPADAASRSILPPPGTLHRLSGSRAPQRSVSRSNRGAPAAFSQPAGAHYAITSDTDETVGYGGGPAGSTVSHSSLRSVRGRERAGAMWRSSSLSPQNGNASPQDLRLRSDHTPHQTHTTAFQQKKLPSESDLEVGRAMPPAVRSSRCTTPATTSLRLDRHPQTALAPRTPNPASRGAAGALAAAAARQAERETASRSRRHKETHNEP
eukprot:GHVT01046000.1.p1 GENE.GHVT01046000.1~~GHVT01046000.1.p1  ORF type:complete len:1513 (+),score=278.53 GHVT01046000.1:275-4540(+)